jgi:hypothetical protein
MPIEGEVVEPVVESPATLVTGEETPITEVTPEVTPDLNEDGTPKDVAPEELEFTVPEGMEVNEPLMGEFKDLAKELGITQEVGQKLIDLQTAHEQKRADESTQAWNDMQATWVNDAKADKEYGGTEMNANLAVAKKTIDQFGTPELKEMLDFTGAGNHPEIIRLFYRVGKAISDDNLVMGTNPAAPAQRDPAKIMFPEQN